eukprot:gene9804-13222_t
MTAEVALRVGLAAGKLFRRDHGRRPLVVIGKDTRLSGYMIEPALVAGFTSMGMDVRLFGPLPTPAVAMMTRSMRADLGVMISASHNAFTDNGIKLFGPDGYKLSDARELEIEAHMDEGLQEGLVAPGDLGRVRRIDDAQARYIEIAKASFPRLLNLNGLKVVIDCANGAAYKVAPEVLYELGAEVTPVGVVAKPFNTKELGEWEAKLRPGFMPMKVKLDDGMKFAYVGKSWDITWSFLKTGVGMVLGKLLGQRWVGAGAALQGRMLQAALKAGVEIRTETPVKELIVEDGKVVGVVTKMRRVRALLGVLVNEGRSAE